MDKLWSALEVAPQDVPTRRFLWRAIRRHKVCSVCMYEGGEACASIIDWNFGAGGM
jgi:hypothetical protein